ncbi:MAG: DegT/DnrJ/EryC1/StrS family aminotransferase, partial [Pseudomonadota bacterium]
MNEKIQKKTKILPFGKPIISETVVEKIADVLRSGQLVHGKKTQAFEEAFAMMIGARYAVSVSSCTAGLHLALMALDIGPGDRVAVPSMTHVSTAHVVELVGGTPVFIDCDATSGNMSVSDLRDKARGLKACIAMHYIGLPADMDGISRLAQEFDFAVIEDVATALGATYGGKNVGKLARCGVFSFYPVKHMTTIEGGMVTTDDPALADTIRKTRAFGYDKALGERALPGQYGVDALGLNYRMSEIEAVIGLAQLEQVAEFLQIRARNWKILHDVLSGLKYIRCLPDHLGKAQGSYYCMNVIVQSSRPRMRDLIGQQLKARGIGYSLHYPGPVPLFAYYQGKYHYTPTHFPVACDLADRTLSLPVGPHLQEADMEYLGMCVRAIVEDIAGSASHGENIVSLDV